MSKITCSACGEEVDEVYPAASKKWPLQCMDCLMGLGPEKRMCSDDPQRPCDCSCAAFNVRVANRVTMRRDQTGAWGPVTTRHPVYVPFCDKHRHPLICMADGESIEEPKEERRPYQ